MLGPVETNGPDAEPALRDSVCCTTGPWSEDLPCEALHLSNLYFLQRHGKVHVSPQILGWAMGLETLSDLLSLYVAEVG